MKYRKKPVVIEAIQFFDDAESISLLSSFITGQDVVVDYKDIKNPVLKIETFEGTMFANIGDYIIKGVQGEFYPCKPNIFEETYELVED